MNDGDYMKYIGITLGMLFVSAIGIFITRNRK